MSQTKTEEALPEPPKWLIGRDEEFAQVARFLRGEGPDVLVVTGMPGVGKTALVRAAVKSSSRPNITFDLASASFVDVVTAHASRELDFLIAPTIGDLVASLKAKQSIIIVENLDHPDGVKSYVDYGGWFSENCVIILTRNENFGRGRYRRIALSPLRPDDSENLLRREVPRLDIGGLQALMRVTMGLPLGIELVADKLRTTSVYTPESLAHELERGGDLVCSDSSVRSRLFLSRGFRSLHGSLANAAAAFAALERDYPGTAFGLDELRCLAYAGPDGCGNSLGMTLTQRPLSDLDAIVHVGRSAGIVLSMSKKLGQRTRFHPLVRAWLLRPRIEGIGEGEEIDENGKFIGVEARLEGWFFARLSASQRERAVAWAELDEERSGLLWHLDRFAGVDWLIRGTDYALSRADLTSIWREKCRKSLLDSRLSEKAHRALREALDRLGGVAFEADREYAQLETIAGQLEAAGLTEDAERVRARVPPRSPAEPLTEPTHILQLKLHDWRHVTALDYGFAVPQSADAGQWIFFLGSNGAGKSSILRAIALALVSDEVGETLLSLSGLSAPHVRIGADEASIEIRLGHGELPQTRVRLGAESETMPNRNGRRRPFVVAYGCRRGTSLGGAHREVEFRPVEAVRTLFDEGAALIHAETWLRRWALASAQKQDAGNFFPAVIETLRALLPGVDSIDVEPTRVWVRGPAVGRVPLPALSDGYLTTAGWVLDMVARWSEHAIAYKQPLDGNFAKSMTGVAIVDEIDLHLHPRWQREVIDQVRQAFPKMSFVVTTHNPVTLLDARPGEVHIMRRADDGLVTVEQRDVPRGIGLERLITGPWFDLPTVLDDDTLGLLNRNRGLLAKPERTPGEQEELEETMRVLRRRMGHYAEISLERIAESVAAEVLAEQAKPAAKLSAEDRERARALIRDRLRARTTTQQEP